MQFSILAIVSLVASSSVFAEVESPLQNGLGEIRYRSCGVWSTDDAVVRAVPGLAQKSSKCRIVTPSTSCFSRSLTTVTFNPRSGKCETIKVCSGMCKPFDSIQECESACL